MMKWVQKKGRDGSAVATFLQTVVKLVYNQFSIESTGGRFYLNQINAL